MTDQALAHTEEVRQLFDAKAAAGRPNTRRRAGWSGG